MKMIELTKEKFYDFVKNNKYNNFCQTENYAKAMKYNNYQYMYIAYTTNDYEILAAGMFLTKKINHSISYAYCPKGYIIDYDNIELVRKFSKNIIKFLKRKNIIFLRINPEVPIATIDYNKNFEKKNTEHKELLEELKKIGFMKRKEKTPLTLLEPKLTAILDLKEYNKNNLDKNFKEKINYAENKGFALEITDSLNLDALKKITKPDYIDYYKNIYEEFKKDEYVDFVILKINYEKFLLSAKKRVEKEQENNDMLNETLQKKQTEDILNKKMESDKILEEYKQDVIKATAGLKTNDTTCLAAAIVIKYKNKVSFILADENPDYTHLEPIYYLYNELIEKYKENYEFADFYGIANDFSKDSKFEKINNIKLGFNPTLYEYIGELDIITSPLKHKLYGKNITYSKILHKKEEKKSL